MRAHPRDTAAYRGRVRRPAPPARRRLRGRRLALRGLASSPPWSPRSASRRRAACRCCRGSARLRQSPRAGAAMSPSTEPLSRMSTFSVAVTLPVTSPRMMTDLANTCALIRPFGPMVSTFCRSSILPSTCPSIVRSSLPFSSPLMTTDLPMFTATLLHSATGSLLRAGRAPARLRRRLVRSTGVAPAAGPSRRRRRLHRFIPFPHGTLSTCPKSLTSQGVCFDRLGSRSGQYTKALQSLSSPFTAET